MKPLISLVIPVYNVDKYLHRCMQTVLSQTYENFEVILVDDGSTDHSGEVCDEYAKKDKRVRVFHKRNGGLSDARNFGVELACGEFVSFIDSDDYVTSDYLEHLYSLIEKDRAEISCGRIQKEYTACVPETNMSEEVVRLTPDRAMIEICYERDISVSACAKLYKKELLSKHPYPVGMLYEDLATTYKLIGDSTQIAVSNKVIYYYYIHNGSIMHDNISEKQFMILDAADAQLEYVMRHFPCAEQAARVRCASAAVSLLSKNNFFSNENAKIFFARVRKYICPHLQAVIMDNVKSIRFKAGCIAIAMGYYPAMLMWRLKARKV